MSNQQIIHILYPLNPLYPLNRCNKINGEEFESVPEEGKGAQNVLEVLQEGKYENHKVEPVERVLPVSLGRGIDLQNRLHRVHAQERKVKRAENLRWEKQRGEKKRNEK